MADGNPLQRFIKNVSKKGWAYVNIADYLD